MYLLKPIEKALYLFIIFSLLISTCLPPNLTRAQISQKSNYESFGNSHGIQENNFVFFGPSEEEKSLNDLEQNFSQQIGKGQTITAKDIKALQVPSKEILRKKQVIQKEAGKTQEMEPAPKVSTISDQDYFDRLLQGFNLSQPKTAAQAESFDWKKINYKKPVSIEGLVKQVPNEIADEIIFPETKIVKGETSREKCTT